MYGGGAYSEFAYSEDPSAAQQLFLDKVGVERCWLLELDGFPLAPSAEGETSGSFAEASFGEVGFAEGEVAAGAGIATLYFSDLGYTSHVPDSPSATWYDGRLKGEFRIARQIYGRGGIGGLARVNGAVSLVNTDGGLDALLRDYSLPGRAARLYVGPPEEPKVNFTLVFSGVIDGTPKVGLDVIELRVSDGAARLAKILNQNTYAGSGGLEGGDDLKGKYKPKAYGKPENVLPPLVDSVKLIYQVHDGAINDVPAVYDRANALARGADYASQADMDTTAPAAGDYRVWKAGGFFRLGSTPAGTVTCDVKGDATPSYIETTGDIVERLLSVQAGLSAAEIDASAIAQLNAAAPAPVHYWCGVDGRMIDQAIDEMLAGVGAFGGFNRTGAFTAGVITTPSGVTTAAYTEEEIGPLERLALPAPVDPIVWRAHVGYARNHTVQTDVAAIVSAARRTFVAQAIRLEPDEDAVVQSQHRLARELLIAGLYRDQADAQAEATRLMNLWGTPRALFKLPLPLSALTRELNESILLTHPRHGLADGVEGRVLAHAIEARKVELEVLT